MEIFKNENALMSGLFIYQVPAIYYTLLPDPVTPGG